MNLADIRDKATIPLWPDAGKLLGCSRNVAYEAARRGEIPTLRLGRNIRVPVPKLLALLGVEDIPTPIPLRAVTDDGDNPSAA